MENFYANELLIKNPNNKNFQLHTHDFYEIYMFEKGNAEYIVEGNTYTLEPDDIIIIRRHEMHRAFHKGDGEYIRTVIEVYPEFFAENNCKEYEKSFLESGEVGNKISAAVVRETGIKDAILRLKRYSCEYENVYTPVCVSIIVEILYLISGIDKFSVDESSNRHIRDIMVYINNNYTENISLENLAERFFISKHHLCRIFKEATGHTVHSYVTRKRITKVGELRKEGNTFGEAAYLAGFGNYTSFYRAYLKEFGISPKNIEK